MKLGLPHADGDTERRSWDSEPRAASATRRAKSYGFDADIKDAKVRAACAPFYSLTICRSQPDVTLLLFSSHFWFLASVSL